MPYSIILDAGHGGAEPGAIYNDRREKDDTLNLTLEVGRILSEQGYDVKYTRTTDVYQTPFQKVANVLFAHWRKSWRQNRFPTLWAPQ